MDVTHLRLVAKALYRDRNPRSPADRLPPKKADRLLTILHLHHVDLAELRPGGNVVAFMCAVCCAASRNE